MNNYRRRHGQSQTQRTTLIKQKGEKALSRKANPLK